MLFVIDVVKQVPDDILDDYPTFEIARLISQKTDDVLADAGQLAIVIKGSVPSTKLYPKIVAQFVSNFSVILKKEQNYYVQLNQLQNFKPK